MICIIAVAVLSPLFLVGESEDNSSASSEGTNTQVEKRAVDASTAQVEKISQFLRDGVRIDHAVAVESEHHEEAYWVGATLTHDSWDEPHGAVWLVSGSKGEPGMTLAASSYAEEMSVGSSVRDTDAWSSKMLKVVVPLRRHVEDGGNSG